jgi:hypothetical protein
MVSSRHHLRAVATLAALAASLGLAGCSGAEPGAGAVSIRLSGEGAAKTGYPYSKNGAEILFTDGWRVRFSKYLVSVGQLRLTGADDVEAFRSDEVFVTDLHRGDPTVLVREGLQARRWERFSFRVLPPPEEAKIVGEVASADLARMQRDGLNYWIEGIAEKNGRSVSFAWGLSNATRATNCTNGLDGTEGIVVRNNATTEAEITFHLDHLFWDTLGTEVANLRFDAIAATAGDDSVVSLDEVATQPLADLRGPDGSVLMDANGKRIFYNPGSVPLPEPNLRAFMLATSAGQAHLNGVGLCTISRL